MRRSLDAGTLDAIVIGTAEDDDLPAWESLVVQAGGSEAWSAATARRRRLDAMASAVLGRPWLARVLREVAIISRRLRSRPAVEPRFAFPDAQLQALTAAALGPDEGGAGGEEIQPAWGVIVPVRLRIGDRVAFEAPADSPAVEVRYLCQGRDGPLPRGGWRLESGEAPVLLLALFGADSVSTLSEALLQATAIAGVVLLEPTSIEETSG